MSGPIRVIIADDHPLVRSALRQSVEKRFTQAAVTEVGTFEETVAEINAAGDADLLLLDLNMPGAEGFSGLMYLRAQHPGMPLIVVSGNDDPAVIRRCMGFGASGYIPKTVNAETMGNAIQAVLDGGSWTPPDVDMSAAADRDTSELVKKLASLTPQQVRVLMMLSQGLLNKQIAYELSVSEATVKAHVSAILQKLDVDSRTQAVIAASRIAKAGAMGGADPA
ncbi:MAG: response regulator [Beijerinckiaceae bacterium]